MNKLYLALVKTQSECKAFASNLTEEVRFAGVQVFIRVIVKIKAKVYIYSKTTPIFYGS